MSTLSHQTKHVMKVNRTVCVSLHTQTGPWLVNWSRIVNQSWWAHVESESVTARHCNNECWVVMFCVSFHRDHSVRHAAARNQDPERDARCQYAVMMTSGVASVPKTSLTLDSDSINVKWLHRVLANCLCWLKTYSNAIYVPLWVRAKFNLNNTKSIMS